MNEAYADALVGSKWSIIWTHVATMVYSNCFEYQWNMGSLYFYGYTCWR